MKSNDNESIAPPAESTNDDHEEECVICLEPLSDNFSWGRCTPCQHCFHKSCWWQWENAHNERVHKSRRRGDIPPGELRPPKCCLCNAVNEKFVDVEGLPVTNPEPFVPPEDEEDGDGSSFFSRIGSMSFNPENLTLENIQQALRNADIGIPPQLLNDPNFVRELSEYSLGLLNGRGGGQGGDDSNAGQRGMGALNPSGIFQRMFGGGDGSAAAAPSNNAQSNTNNDNVGPPFNELRQGTPVVTQNLVSSPGLNGRQGQIVRLDSSNGRYLVRLRPTAAGATETTVAMKPENILQMARVKVHGLQSQPQLNGSDGQILSYSTERDRYVVRVAYIDQEVLRSLPPQMQLEVSLHPRETRDISVSSNNIRIAVGTHVRLEGLVQGVQWNGRYGRVTKWIDGGEGGVGRYEVRLSRQHAVQVRPQNVRL